MVNFSEQQELKSFASAPTGKEFPELSDASFHEILHHSKIFQNKFFCVFGVGDITYTNFNSVGLKVDQNLGKLHGRRILDVCMSSTHNSEFGNKTYEKWQGEV